MRAHVDVVSQWRAHVHVCISGLFQACGYPLQDDEGISSGQVDFDWNPYADCKEFSFYDQGFLDKIKDGHTVRCLY